MSTIIPDVFHEAAQIFLDELNSHVSFFQEMLAALNSAEGRATFGAKEARLLAEKFHLVKGASGFLKLTELKEAAGSAEKYFRDTWASDCNPDEAKAELTKASKVVSEQRDLLRAQLPSS